MLSTSGKPVYARYGDADKAASLWAVVAALLAFFEDMEDVLRWVVVDLVMGMVLECARCAQLFGPGAISDLAVGVWKRPVIDSCSLPGVPCCLWLPVKHLNLNLWYAACFIQDTGLLTLLKAQGTITLASSSNAKYHHDASPSTHLYTAFQL